MKPFLTKLLLFLLIAYLCQLLVSNIFPAKIPITAINFNPTLQKGRIEIAYFVDSTDYIADSLDKNTDAISLLLQRLLVCYRIGVIARPAGNPDIYAAYAAYFSRFRSPPRYVIIQINMRAFSPIWDREPTWGFEEEKRYFRIFADTPFMPFWPFFSDNASFFSLDSLPENKYQNMPIFNKLQKLGFMKDEKYTFRYVPSGDNIRDLIERHYMYYLTKDHRKIQSLLEIVDIFASKKTKLIYYFTPINYQPKKAYIGNNFETQLRKNVDLVKLALLNKNVTVLDLSMSLPSEAFTYEGPHEAFYVNEHLTEQGRRFVAESLTSEIKKERPSCNIAQKNTNLGNIH